MGQNGVRCSSVWACSKASYIAICLGTAPVGIGRGLQWHASLRSVCKWHPREGSVPHPDMCTLASSPHSQIPFGQARILWSECLVTTACDQKEQQKQPSSTTHKQHKSILRCRKYIAAATTTFDAFHRTAILLNGGVRLATRKRTVDAVYEQTLARDNYRERKRIHHGSTLWLWLPWRYSVDSRPKTQVHAYVRRNIKGTARRESDESNAVTVYALYSPPNAMTPSLCCHTLEV